MTHSHHYLNTRSLNLLQSTAHTGSKSCTWQCVFYIHIHLYMCMYVYITTHWHKFMAYVCAFVLPTHINNSCLSLTPLFTIVYIHIYMYICICVYIYMYIYITTPFCICALKSLKNYAFLKTHFFLLLFTRSCAQSLLSSYILA